MSAKGSPGVTTLGLAMACASGDVLVEMDRAGGDLALRAGVAQSPGLVDVAVRQRRGHDGTAPAEAFTQRLGSGALVVPAPVSATAVSSVLSEAGAHTGIAAALGSDPPCPRLLLDIGRSGPDLTALESFSALHIVVARCDATSLGHALELIRGVARRERIGLVLIENGGFGAREAAAELEVPLLGVLPWHTRHAARLTDAVVAQTPHVNKLVRATAAILTAADAMIEADKRRTLTAAGAWTGSSWLQEAA